MLSEVNIVTDLRKLKFIPIYHSERLGPNRFGVLEVGMFYVCNQRKYSTSQPDLIC